MIEDTGGAPWAANVYANFRKFETALMVYSGAWEKLIHEKKQKSKISWHRPFEAYQEGTPTKWTLNVPKIS